MNQEAGDEAVRLKDGVRLDVVEDIRVHVVESDLTESDRKEIRFWGTSREEGPGSDLFDNIMVKAPELRVFERLLPRLDVRAGMRCLEVAAGQAWPSVMLKRTVPGAFVHASELSVAALRSAAKWEALLGRRLDGKWACSARDLPFADGQFDRVFTYAAFHHLGVAGDFTPALDEIIRVLKPGGRAMLLREPSAPGLLLDWQRRRVNRVRKIDVGADVDEDIVVPGDLADMARRRGARLEVTYDTNWAFLEMGLVRILGKAILRVLPALGRMTPCGVNLLLVKPPAKTDSPPD